MLFNCIVEQMNWSFDCIMDIELFQRERQKLEYWVIRWYKDDEWVLTPIYIDTSKVRRVTYSIWWVSKKIDCIRTYLKYYDSKEKEYKNILKRPITQAEENRKGTKNRERRAKWSH